MFEQLEEAAAWFVQPAVLPLPREQDFHPSDWAGNAYSVNPCRIGPLVRRDDVPGSTVILCSASRSRAPLRSRPTST
jgi:hypothetical protein